MCLCSHPLGVCGGQELQPAGKHRSERIRGRLMVTASARLAAREDTQTDTLCSPELLSKSKLHFKDHQGNIFNLQRECLDNRKHMCNSCVSIWLFFRNISSVHMRLLNLRKKKKSIALVKWKIAYKWRVNAITEQIKPQLLTEIFQVKTVFKISC